MQRGEEAGQSAHMSAKHAKATSMAPTPQSRCVTYCTRKATHRCRFRLWPIAAPRAEPHRAARHCRVRDCPSTSAPGLAPIHACWRIPLRKLTLKLAAHSLLRARARLARAP